MTGAYPVRFLSVLTEAFDNIIEARYPGLVEPRPWLSASRSGWQMHGIHEIFCSMPGASECPYGQRSGLCSNNGADIR